MGTKILRQRLKGPSMTTYYPPKTASIESLQRAFGPVLATWEERKEARLDKIEE